MSENGAIVMDELKTIKLLQTDIMREPQEQNQLMKAYLSGEWVSSRAENTDGYTAEPLPDEGDPEYPLGTGEIG